MIENISEQNTKPLVGPKLSKVVIWVLAAHVAAILGYGTYCLLNGKTGGRVGGEESIVGMEEPTVGESGATADQVAVEGDAVAPVTPDDLPTVITPEPAAPIQPARLSVTSAPEPLTATTVAGATYTARKGDSLYKIARENNVTVAALRQANGLADNTALKIGQTLTIPGAPAVAPQAVVRSVPPTPTPVTPAPRPAVAYQSYKVAPGDTLWKIARAHGTTADAVAKANNITDPAKLKVGMEIKIPVRARETAQPPAAPTNVDVANVPARLRN